jgi:hypothetical protein
MGPQNACKRTTSDRLDGGLAFRELCGDTGGLDKERTMSDPERLVGARARTSLSSPPGFDRPGARFLLLQQEKARAELTRLPIEGAAQLLLFHRSSSDERADSAPAAPVSRPMWEPTRCRPRRSQNPRGETGNAERPTFWRASVKRGVRRGPVRTWLSNVGLTSRRMLPPCGCS